VPLQLAPMRIADLDAVVAIECSAYSHPWTRGNFVDSLAAGYLARVARDEHAETVGYFIAMTGVDEVHLLNLAVKPALQGRGHGRALLQALCEECAGVPALVLEVRQSNAAARRLYRRFGFDEIGLRRDYYPAAAGRREDAVVMRLRLQGGARALV
jgi:ribosomal-protein-alanine N-acetyltransferase